MLATDPLCLVLPVAATSSAAALAAAAACSAAQLGVNFDSLKQECYSHDTRDNITHTSGTVGAQNLDSDEFGSLGDTVLL